MHYGKPSSPQHLRWYSTGFAGGTLTSFARTTPRVRAELQATKTSSHALAAQYGINPKTILKWRKRASTADATMGPKNPKNTVLTAAEEAIIVEFRRRTLLPLDDTLGCLRDTIPNVWLRDLLYSFGDQACLGGLARSGASVWLALGQGERSFKPLSNDLSGVLPSKMRYRRVL